MSRAADPLPDPTVLDAFSLASAPLERATSGLINPTWFVWARDGSELVLQRLNAIFPAEVNLDIEAVTRHLLAKGIATPTLVTSRCGVSSGTSGILLAARSPKKAWRSALHSGVSIRPLNSSSS